jgi:aryl-alcohol dehydrogenase-like predicted oxidoreductase
MSVDGSGLSRLALGCYALGGGYGKVDLDEARATVDAAISSGWNFFDTAEAYLESEERLGEMLEGRRERVFIATKVFPCEPYSAANIEKALQNSLKKLRTDYIDLYQLHGPQNWINDFEGSASFDEIAETMRALLASGKVLNFGVCNMSVETMQELHKRVQLFSTQNLYSIFDQGHDDDEIHLPVGNQIIPWSIKNGVKFFAFSPLARGLLSDGQIASRIFPKNDERHFLPRFQPEIFPEWAAISIELEGWAKDHGINLVQLAVAWTLSCDGVTSTLVGAKTPKQVEAFAGSESFVLSSSDFVEIENIVAKLSPQASRAKSIVWDHFPPEAVQAMANQRHGRVNVVEL